MTLKQKLQLQWQQLLITKNKKKEVSKKTSFLCGKYLISLFKLFYNIKQTLFSKITDVTGDSSKYFLKLSAVRKVLETLGSKLIEHGLRIVSKR